MVRCRALKQGYGLVGRGEGLHLDYTEWSGCSLVLTLVIQQSMLHYTSSSTFCKEGTHRGKQAKEQSVHTAIIHCLCV